MPAHRAAGSSASAIGAAIDVGSNSVHCLVARVVSGRLHPLIDRSDLLGLGDVVDRDQVLPPASVDALIGSLTAFTGLAAEAGAARLVVLGTEPLRRATNRDAVASAVEAATRQQMVILSHQEEAYLTLLGVAAEVDAAGSLLVVDVGGGSSEYLVTVPSGLPTAAALSTGSMRLTRHFVAHDPPLRSEYELMLGEARRLVRETQAADPDAAVFVGGTASNLLKVGERPPSNRRLDAGRLSEALTVLLAEPAARAATRHAIHERRARLLPGGIAIVQAFMERYGLPDVLVSEASLRDGAILALHRAGAAWRMRLPELVSGEAAWSVG
ncbi:MAG: rod shape-determining protein [Chloroflexi bacterium]|nr:rod shape-determining protein [Chloroflexota bacterium]